jgi:drug/metabolite transporter (DMT)-like permease
VANWLGDVSPWISLQVKFQPVAITGASILLGGCALTAASEIAVRRIDNHDTTEQSPHARLQFRLRDILIALTAICLILAIAANASLLGVLVVYAAVVCLSDFLLLQSRFLRARLSNTDVLKIAAMGLFAILGNGLLLLAIERALRPITLTSCNHWIAPFIGLFYCCFALCAWERAGKGVRNEWHCRL